MQTATDFRIVFVTTDSLETSKQISRILVTEKIAACCTIFPHVTSYFGWQGNVNERYESMIMIKTSAGSLEQLEKRILELHNDEVPEIIAVQTASGLDAYLDWMEHSTANE